MQAKGTVGVLALDQDLKTNWAEKIDPEFGMGRFACG